MENYTIYILLALITYIVSYVYYIKISHGLGNKATYLQMRRFLPCAFLSFFPAALVHLSPTSPILLILYIISALWITTYPALYWISNHNVSSDFEFHFEIVFALYFTAWITSLLLLFKNIPLFTIPGTILISIIEFIILLIPIAQIVYFCLYKACINENGMQMLLETHYNEIIEFFKSLPNLYNIVISLFSIISFSVINYFNYIFLANVNSIDLNLQNNIILLLLTFFLTTYLWKKNHGVFIRTAIVEFYLDIKDYLNTNKLYKKNLQERLKELVVTPLTNYTNVNPVTFILVIGESASRDYMKSFNEDYHLDTTPWLTAMKKTKNFILFSNSFSSSSNTVASLSRALTESNQYNDKEFYESCSIVDIAHKLGFKVHWYSNQGHLGCADTPITLMADTADVAKWTKQHLNTIQYDESLLPYLDEVNPEKNNFIIIHLKGSHFNFQNRYPLQFTKFGIPGKYDLELNYANSIAYTDKILEEIFNYAKNKFNLQSMIYFSDHAAIPDKRRSPNFEGLASVRIPLFTYFSDTYINQHPTMYDTLIKHKDNYWTNDLAYELICNILDIQSNKFDETNSLASEKFKYTRENLRTNSGNNRI